MNELFDGKIKVRVSPTTTHFKCFVCGKIYSIKEWDGNLLRSRCVCRECAQDLDFIVSQTYEADLVRNLIRMTRHKVESDVFT